MTKAALHNLGCKVNAYELEAMRQMLSEGGFEIVPFDQKADIYIVNTCTVTNIADRKSRQMLHKAKKMNPSGIVIAVGCYVQASADKLKADEAIDIIIGNNKKKDLLAIIADYRKTEGKLEVVEDLSVATEYEELRIYNKAKNARAYIKVQDGCNQFCTYCIIPYMRGRVRSRDMKDVLQEVEQLAQKGFKEVVLTGIHLSSYGLERDEKGSLIELIKNVHQVDGIKRIRLGSLEPGIITEEFVRELVKLDKVCPHFHLSLQSGCDETLERMNRRYRTSEYKEKCDILRKHYKKAAITTDVIAGFPGEDEREFAQTKQFVKDIKFYEMHVFKYSPRQGTKAAKMPNQVEEAVKAKRSKELIIIGEKNKRLFLESILEQRVEVLIEETITLEEKEYWVGHTKEYLQVIVDKTDASKGEIVSVVAQSIIAKEYVLGEMP